MTEEDEAHPRPGAPPASPQGTTARPETTLLEVLEASSTSDLPAAGPPTPSGGRGGRGNHVQSSPNAPVRGGGGGGGRGGGRSGAHPQQRHPHHPHQHTHHSGGGGGRDAAGGRRLYDPQNPRPNMPTTASATPQPISLHQQSGLPHGHVPAYLCGSASLVEELDARLLVVLRDGRHLIGVRHQKRERERSAVECGGRIDRERDMESVLFAVRLVRPY